MKYEIKQLPRDKWTDYILPIGYTTDEYYDVTVENQDGFIVNIKKKRFDSPVTHSPDEYDYPDKLYAPHWEKAYAWGIADVDRLLAAIETCPEEWSNRLCITELWVDEALRHEGVGHELISIALEQARLERRRAVILETQSCNANAIGFYLHEGFKLIGFDSCCYANNDLERKEVRLELGILYDKPERLAESEIEIRSERPDEYYETELMVYRAFYNKFKPGCNEHLLVHKLRDNGAYLPEFSRVAIVDGKVVGTIMYSKAKVTCETVHEVITFGPLCVDREYQGRGVGELLLRKTVELARAAGYPGIVIFGEPDYYPRFGFQTCDKFGITTSDGKNFSSFMALPFNESFSQIHGRFDEEPDVFSELDDCEEFDKAFPPMVKRKFPKQFGN